MLGHLSHSDPNVAEQSVLFGYLEGFLCINRVAIPVSHHFVLLLPSYVPELTMASSNGSSSCASLASAARRRR